MQTIPNPHAILLASPGIGHLVPVLELGNRLSAHHGFDVTVFVVTTDSTISKSPDLLCQSPATKKPLNIVLLPPVDVSTLVSPTASIVTRIRVMMRAAVPPLRAAISAMSTRPTALVVDIFGTEAMAVAREFNMLKYVFVTSTAWFLAVTVHLPSLGEKEKHEHSVLKKPLEVPGCRQVRFEDTMEIFKDRTDPELYPGFVQIGVEFLTADGILVNTWGELEPETLNELRNKKLLGRVMRPVPVYPIGPLVRPVKPSSRSEIVAWLDEQPKESVIYVSFGSGGTLSAKQTIELAWGLELSRQRFVWVVRPPVDNDVSSSAFFNTPPSTVVEDGTPDYLPEGFFTRTRGVGLVVPMWAPQTEVLAHASVGAFLSHCGWNSTLESMVNGVPIVAWPLYAEQKMNATMLVEEVGTAARLGLREAASKAAVVGREAIRDVVMGVMSNRGGDEMRARARELRGEAKEAVRKGGSSHNSLSQVAVECRLKLHRLTSEALGA